MSEAKRIYASGKFRGDQDKDFFIVKGARKNIWFSINDYGKLTAMLPSDY